MQNQFSQQKPRGRGRPREFWPARKLRLIAEWQQLREAGRTYDDAVAKLADSGFSKSTIERTVATWSRDQKRLQELRRLFGPTISARWRAVLVSFTGDRDLPL